MIFKKFECVISFLSNKIAKSSQAASIHSKYLGKMIFVLSWIRLREY